MYAKDLLKGKKILITGGGTGLGKATAHRMAGLGAHIVICGRREKVLQDTAAEITAATGGLVDPIPCDIREYAQIESMMDKIWSTGPLDVLINNAAANFLARTETVSERAFDAIMRIGLNGSAHCTIQAGRRWIAEKRPGTIINILTTGAEDGRPFTVALTMAKSALLSMVRSLAVEWGPKGIRSIGVAPGLFPTPGSSEALFPEGRQRPEIRSGIPLGRYGRHDEFADLLTYLCSDQAGYINGVLITMDGGRSVKGLDVDDLFSWTDEQWAAIKAKRTR